MTKRELSKVRAAAGRKGGIVGGSKGGASRSEAKVAAARANGKLGGRPRKIKIAAGQGR